MIYDKTKVWLLVVKDTSDKPVCSDGQIAQSTDTQLWLLTDSEFADFMRGENQCTKQSEYLIYSLSEPTIKST